MIHEQLFRHCDKGNGDVPVSSRFQSNPRFLREVLGKESIATKVAEVGAIFDFTEKPTQMSRPPQKNLTSEGQQFFLKEVDRLHHVCEAIEQVPDHDGDLPLIWAQAKRYELQPFPSGPWPEEAKVPVMNIEGLRDYHREQLRLMKRRRSLGRPFRDFESSGFTVPKPNMKLRLCMDERALNEHVEKQRFKMEGIQAATEIIQPGDHAILMDLEDCYIQVGIAPAHRKYFRFRDPKQRRWQWKTLCFGAGPCPRIVTKILRPLIQVLRSLGIRALMYIDDLLILEQDRLKCARAAWVACELLQILGVGLKIKLDKSNFKPLQVFTFLGLIFNSLKMELTAPIKRINAVVDIARRLEKLAARPPKPGHTSFPVKTRDLARFNGQAVSLMRAIRPAKRRLLFIQQSLANGIRKGGWHGQTFLSFEALKAMRWWTTRSNLDRVNGDDIRPRTRTIQVTVAADAKATDSKEIASFGGWLEVNGVHLTTRGFFTAKESLMHVNWLELKAQQLTRQALLPKAVPRKDWHNVHVSHVSDNTAAVKYGNVSVSRSLTLSKLGAEIFDDEQELNLTSSHSHIAGVLQVEADYESRVKSTHVDWSLDKSLFRKAVSMLLRGRKVRVDLFASRANNKVPLYYSYQHDHAALGTNALSVPWANIGVVWMYPPPILLGRCLRKILHEGVEEALVVAPMWAAQSWYPTLVSMTLEPPLLLPQVQWITRTPRGDPSWKCQWRLAVWRISGSKSITSGTDPRIWRASWKGCQSEAIKRRMTRLSDCFLSGPFENSDLTPSIVARFAPPS